MFIHADFFALALVVLRYSTTTKGVLGFAPTLALANDVLDYGLGYYPLLKYEAGALPVGATVALSFPAMFLASRASGHLPGATEIARKRPTSHSR